MPGSMHVCNPYCGRCKPPKEPLLACTACGTFNDPERGEFGRCKECGAELPPRILPTPIKCLRIGQMCARPCKQGEKPGRLPNATCTHHTPLP